MQDRTATMETIVCGAPGPSEFSVAYESDLFNTINLAGVPTDCLGQAVPVQASPIPGAANFFVSESRFFIQNNTLMCAGNGGAGFAVPQVLAENVEDMRLTYGLTNTVRGDHNEIVYDGRTSNYRSAVFIDTNFLAEPPMDRWNRISSVRICLQLRTDDNVTDAPNAIHELLG